MLRIALDGPAASGKSSVAKVVAKKLGIAYLDTGAMYRCVALKFLEEGIDMENEKSISELLLNTEISFKGENVFLNNADVSDAIREPSVSEFVSKVAAIPLVREFLGRTQVEIGKKSDIIMDGRDIGSVIMPFAEYKFFLTASAEERGKRRKLDLEAKGFKVDLKELIEEINQRDEMDRKRSIAPLVPASDALIIDTTLMSFDAVVEAIVEKCKEKDES